jgi:hypothetical protein
MPRTGIEGFKRPMARIVPTTVRAARHIVFHRVHSFPGLMEMPPVSNVMPLPTSASNSPFLPSIFSARSAERLISRAVPNPSETLKKRTHSEFFHFGFVENFAFQTVSFAIACARFAISVGCRMFGGSFARSRVKFIESPMISPRFKPSFNSFRSRLRYKTKLSNRFVVFVFRFVFVEFKLAGHETPCARCAHISGVAFGARQKRETFDVAFAQKRVAVPKNADIAVLFAASPDADEQKPFGFFFLSEIAEKRRFARFAFEFFVFDNRSEQFRPSVCPNPFKNPLVAFSS